MIIAVDFDGTLEIKGKPNWPLIARLRREQANGGTVILWTCRSGKRLDEAVMFLMKCGLRPNFINRNAPETLRKMGNPRKIFADVYIDEKAVKP